jgi:hypothetical protein
VNGPHWVTTKIFPESHRMAASTSADTWTVEAAFTPVDGRLPQEGQTIGLRLDVVPETELNVAPYVPRSMAFVRLSWDASEDLFPGLSWKPSFLVRSFARDDTIKVRYGFHAEKDTPVLKSVEIRAEGNAKDVVNNNSSPFPKLGKGGNVGIDYASRIDNRALDGYHVLRATLTSMDGQVCLLRSSIRIAELLDIDVDLPQSVLLASEAKVVKGGVTLRSQATGRIDGTFTYELPKEWTLSKGNNANVLIYHTRGTWKTPIEFIVPRGTSGVFPITFTCKIGPRLIKKTRYIQVQ